MNQLWERCAASGERDNKVGLANGVLQSSLVLRFVKVSSVIDSSDISSYKLTRHCQDQFDDYRESTIGAAFLTQTIALDDSTTVKFEIWDTAGQERYKSLAPMYYRNANCAVVVYDITQAVCFFLMLCDFKLADEVIVIT